MEKPIPVDRLVRVNNPYGSYPIHAYVKRDYQMEIQGLGCPARKSKATILAVLRNSSL